MTVTAFILSLLCIFEVVCVPAILLHMSLRVVVVLYLFVVAGYIFILYKKKKLPRCKKMVKIGGSEKERQGFEKWKWAAVLLVLFQLVMVTAYTHVDDDDAWYLGSAADAYETGDMFMHLPYTGADVDFTPAKDYVLSPLPMLWAAIATVTRIHPTILAHTVAPAFLLLWAYGVYYMLGMRLFEKEKYAWLFVFFLSVLNIFGGFSVRTSGVFLLYRIWQGKAIFYTILVPLLFYYYLGILKKSGDECKAEMTGIYLTMGAGCLVSFTAVSLMPLLLLAMALTYAVAKKSCKILLGMCKAMIPNVVLILLYVFVV